MMETKARKRIDKLFVASHIMFILLLIVIMLPSKKITQPATALVVGLFFMELMYLYQCLKANKEDKALTVPSCIVMIVWTIILVWEIAVTKFDIMHPVLYPAPENVFYVFQTQYMTICENILSTLALLSVSILIGVFMGVTLGVVVGWHPLLREVLYPIANVLTPIPAIVYAPYIISLMPSFRSASSMVIVIGIFFPMFLNMINRVKSMDREIIDSARMLNVSDSQMIVKILLPYVAPGIVSGMKVTLTTSFMLLMFAEMMGATKGLGYYIVNYNTYGNYTNVIACIIVIGILVTVMNKLTTVMQKKLIKWQ